MILTRIALELAAQHAKWGEQDYHDDYKWLAILVEEVGEVAQAILQANGNEDERVDEVAQAMPQVEDGVKTDEDIEIELVQVAAVTIAWLKARGRRGLNGSLVCDGSEGESR